MRSAKTFVVLSLSAPITELVRSDSHGSPYALHLLLGASLAAFVMKYGSEGSPPVPAAPRFSGPRARVSLPLDRHWVRFYRKIAQMGGLTLSEMAEISLRQALRHSGAIRRAA